VGSPPSWWPPVIAAAAAIRIGLAPTIEAGPLYIAAANGYFRDEGLDAKVKFFDTDARVRSAAAVGHIDVGMADLDASFFADAARHGFKSIASQASDGRPSPERTNSRQQIAIDGGQGARAFRSNPLSIGSRGGIRTPGQAVNSRLLYH
jgi:hypothetical protein